MNTDHVKRPESAFLQALFDHDNDGDSILTAELLSLL